MSLKIVINSALHAVGLAGNKAKATLSTAATASLAQLDGTLAGALAAAAEPSNPLGTAIANAAQKAEASGASGPDKREAVLAEVAPTFVSELATKGITTTVEEVKDFAGLVLEHYLTTIKQTPLGKIAKAVLAALGIG